MNRRFETGARIGAYTVERPLDEGGFGTVYRCRHESGRTAALKLFKESAETASAQRLVAQQNEIEALVRLRHPSLVELYEYGIVEGAGLYVAMELAEGEPLDRHLARHGRMDALEALLVARKIAEALAHCHAFGVLHLDLKPSNVVVVDAQEPRIKVLDFGLATLADTWHAEHTRVAAGTIAYMPPECLVRSADARPSPRMDLYALGTVLYEMLTGGLPFTSDAIGTLVQEKLAGRFRPVSEVLPGTAPSVDALIADLLAPNPEARAANAAHVVGRLRDAYYETLRGARPGATAGATVPPERSVHAQGVGFFGRAHELDELSSRVMAATHGEGRHVLLRGEAGIGKSRILSELFHGIEVSGLALVAYGRCRELSAVVPYSALREALSEIPPWLRRQPGERGARIRAAIARVLGQDGGVLARLVPELSDVAGPPPSGDDLGPGGMRGVADALAALLESLSEEVPVVLAIEDVQWADEATAGVLERVSRAIHGLPAMLVLSARPESGPPASTRAPRGLISAAPGGTSVSALERRVTGLDVIAIEPLPAADNRALIAAVAGGASDQAVNRLIELVPMLGAGNPLFDIQLLHHLETEGWLRRGENGEIEIVAQSGFAAPATLAEALAKSLANLPEAAIRVLAVGALIGQRFRSDDLAELGLFDAGEVERATSLAEEAYLCRADGGAVALSHERLREQLVAGIPAEALPGYHARIAKRMAERGGDPGPLAHHLELAGDRSSAADAFFAAGTQAARMQELLGATRSFARAIDLLLQLPDDETRTPRLARAAHELSRCGALLGNTSEVLASLRRIEAALPESPLVTAALSSSLARIHYVRGEFVDAVGHSRKAIAAATSDPSLQRYQCSPANILGRALCAAGKFGPAIDPLRKGCDLAEAAEEHVELCHSRGILCVALSYAGLFAEAEANAAAATHVAERLRDPARLLGNWFYYAVLAEARGDWIAGMRSTAELLAYAEEHGLTGLYLYMGTMFAGRHQFHIGQLPRARVLLSNAINLGKVLGIGMGQGWAQAYLGDVFFVQGRVADARYCYEKAIEVGSAGGGDAYALGLGRTGKLHLAAMTERDLPLVRSLAAETLEGLRATGNRSTAVTTLERYADSLAELGAADEAAAAQDERDRLAAELGIAQPMFWPHVPHETSKVPPRQYWMTTRVEPSAPDWPTLASAHAATVASHSQTGIERSGERRVHATLFETLAAVEGYVPKFDPKSDQTTTPLRRHPA
jgi:tetratricopeptide (TPR) repeat protein